MQQASPSPLARFRKHSIRTHLILLVLGAVLPALGIIVYSGLEQFRRDWADARNNCMLIVDNIAREQENLTESARLVLATLALLPEVKGQDAQACNILFNKIVRQNTQFVALNASMPDGRVLAAAINSTGFSLSDRKYHKDVLATRSFSIGEYAIARSSGRPTLHYACPVFGNGDQIMAVLAIGTDLAYYKNMLSQTHAPTGSILTIADHAGIILHSSLNPEKNLGKTDSPGLLRHMKEMADGGFFTMRDPDGSKRVYIFRALRLAGAPSPYLYVRIGLPEREAYREVRASVARNLGLLGAAALFAFMVAWLLGERRILRPVRQLVEASHRLAGGDLQAASGIPYHAGELGQLARSFDEMGRALALQEAERSRAVEKLQLTQYAVDHASQAITWIDHGGTRVYANDAFCRLLGYTREELVGHPSWKISRHRHGENWDHLWTEVKARGFMTLETVVVTKTEEERQVELAATHIDFGGREFLMGAMRDITAERQAEERLRQAQKMEAIGTLAGGIAHDFNNLLTGILGYANILTLEAGPGTRTYEAARVIEKAAERAAELTRQLLGFARKGKFLNAPFKVHPLIGEVVSILDRTLDKSITLTQRLSAHQATLIGDPTQVQQVLLNLAVNARDAMPEGGSLTIETSLVHLDDNYCHVHPQVMPGQHVMIAVSDTGHGIPKDLQQRIFEPFFTTKEKGKGTGMGLAMVYGIIKNHHGSIHVYSEEGRGTRFCIYLPASPESDGEVRVETHPAGGPGGARPSGRILLVDDEEIVLNLCRDMLKRLGYQVQSFLDSAKAAEHYQSNWQSIDLVILDMIMPGMDGRECFRALKRAHPGVRAILSSGYSRDGRAQEILDEGMLGFIQKPYRTDELAAAVAAALRVE